MLTVIETPEFIASAAAIWTETERVNTMRQIVARRGRPFGSVKAKPKVAATIRFDQDVLDALKASGRGWQTRVNDAVRDWLARQSNKLIMWHRDEKLSTW